MNDSIKLETEIIELVTISKQDNSISAQVSDDANLFELYGFMDIFMKDLQDRLKEKFSDIESDPLDFS